MERAIDMWSFGCIVAELYTGLPLFPEENEHDVLARMTTLLGSPGKYLVANAPRKTVFFNRKLRLR